MNFNDRLGELKSLCEKANDECECLVGGKKASSARARKHLLDIKHLAHDLRKQVITVKSGIPVKQRKKADEVIPQEAKREPIIEEAPKKKRVKKTE